MARGQEASHTHTGEFMGRGGKPFRWPFNSRDIESPGAELYNFEEAHLCIPIRESAGGGIIICLCRGGLEGIHGGCRMYCGDGRQRRIEDENVYQRQCRFQSPGVHQGILGKGIMLQVTPQMRILLSVKAVDFRKGIDGLAGVCRHILRMDPFSGFVFVFRNRRGTAIKALTYDGQGFWLCQKRLSKGTFKWWPDKSHDCVSILAVHELQLLLWNGDPCHVRVAPGWRKIDSCE